MCKAVIQKDINLGFLINKLKQFKILKLESRNLNKLSKAYADLSLGHTEVDLRRNSVSFRHFMK